MVIEPGENDDRALDNAAPPAAPETPLDAGQEPEKPEPSTGTEAPADDGPKTMAEAIAQALEEGPKAPEEGEGELPKPATAPEPATDKAPDDPASKEPQSEPEKASDDPSDDELQGMRPGPRKRVVELLSQRNSARRERDEISARLQTAEVDAGNYRQITQFMQQSRLENAEVQELFEIGAKLKSNDPRQLNEVLAVLLPLTTGLLELTGRALPADLREKVEAGEVTDELARETARERAARRIAENQATRVSTEQQQEHHQARLTNFQTAVQSAVGAWEETVRKTDLDFGRKRQSLEDAAYAVMARRGPPQSPEQAVAYAKEAYDRVNTALRQAAPARTATRPNPGATGNRSGLSPAPTSLEETIFGALGVRSAS